MHLALDCVEEVIASKEYEILPNYFLFFARIMKKYPHPTFVSKAEQILDAFWNKVDLRRFDVALKLTVSLKIMAESLVEFRPSISKIMGSLETTKNSFSVLDSSFHSASMILSVLKPVVEATTS